ncbi:MAG: DUF167 domain-containing protein [Candidatus Micrarchaeota archaeon]
MILELTVVPKSKKFSIVQKDGKIKVHLKSAPENNKANLELIKELSKVLGCQVRIMSGLKSKHKKLDLDISQEDFEMRLGKN